MLHSEQSALRNHDAAMAVARRERRDAETGSKHDRWSEGHHRGYAMRALEFAAAHRRVFQQERSWRTQMVWVVR